MRSGLTAMLCVAALSAIGWHGSSAHAKTPDAEVTASDKPKKSKDNKKDGKAKNAQMKLTAPGGSAETPAERSARLRRECKGRPNAGACSGYTH